MGRAESGVCPSGRFGVRWLCTLASLGFESLGSWSPNRAKYLQRVFTWVYFPVFFLDDRRSEKGGAGRFEKEILSSRRLFFASGRCARAVVGANSRG